ncbi:IS110 family transposase [Zhaonella formicivorans]|uniref:IS110 family transposase n=1 Tax=Zhaonella formicivorans TaxID=2528593 RepID=UPI001D12AA01|nr:IS110 family transposase [Zhaonella formicivorans]
MQDILEICCGLDVHKETVVACLLKGNVDGEPVKTIRTFSTLLAGLDEMKVWLENENCRHVAMESTGIYWQPVYNVLEEAFDGSMVLIVANARHMKNVPGKKTDMKDAEWIATLLRAGLLEGSFVPSKPIRELRNLTRYRKSIIEEITSQKNRIEKHLQSCGFKLSTFLTDIFGVSGRAIMDHLSHHGKISAREVENFVKGRAKNKLHEIKQAVNGKMDVHQREFLKLLLGWLDQHYEHLRQVEQNLEEKLAQYQRQLEQLDGIPGIDKTAAAAILAEIGIDMSRFKTAEHICSWAGLSPGNNESAGKKKSTRTTNGNTYLKRILCEVAWCITRIRQSYLSSWYWKIKQRRGAKKALVALARKVLVIIYNLLKNDADYDETSFEKAKQKQEKFRVKRIIAEAKKLGLEVIEPHEVA